MQTQLDDAKTPAHSATAATAAATPPSATASASPATSDQGGDATRLSPARSELADLHELLAQGLSYPPEYRDQLANHLPMALHALFELGANPQQLRAFEAGYARRFEGLASPEPAPAAADWLALRGQMSAYAPLRAFFV
ncbi:MAG: questin oxidase family protein, partial [Burkholderiaceae bacterium]|nr:questin oxidase family protein [Burkholderiaceae bacterium]